MKRYWLELFAAVCGVVLVAGVFLFGYDAGRLVERQSSTPVACVSNVDSIRVVPVVWPSGPVVTR